jgi:DNA-binding CsgD family transcriptional regulator
VTAAPGLLGRDPEIAVLRDVIDHARDRGAVLVLRGEAGIGKSSLIAAAVRDAADRGMLILATSGVQAEADLPFAGLHQLIRPVLSGISALPARQRTALLTAFGMADATAPDLFLVALATLDLLSDTADRAPLLLCIEDAQWLDRPTSDVLAFVARRVEAEPVTLLIAIRDGYDSALADAGARELRLRGLDDGSARALLNRHAPRLEPGIRQQVLTEAAGNPLALIELPAALKARQAGRGGTAAPVLPLTSRLEEAFAERARDLPAAAQALLQVAAADDEADLAEVLRAAAILARLPAPENALEEALDPALAAHLVEMDEGEVVFRHPLVRSAIYQRASPSERRSAHAALADVLDGHPDRQVWHRAAATLGPDEEVAADLEAAAVRARRRGAPDVAVATLERAVKMSADPAHRGSRLLDAAELAFELGRPDMVVRLAREAEEFDLRPRDQAQAMWLRESFDANDPGDPARVGQLVDSADRSAASGDVSLALRLLSVAADRCLWGDPGWPARQRIVISAEHAGAAETDPRLLAILAYAAPVERGATVIARLSGLEPAKDADPDAMRLLGRAAETVGECQLAMGFLAASVAGLREQGRLGLLTQALSDRVWATIQLADFSVAMPAAEEAGRLALETSQLSWAAGADATQAIMAAMRGDHEAADALARRTEQVALPNGASGLLAMTQYSRGMSALGPGHSAAAYSHLLRMVTPGDPAYHHLMRYWSVGEFAEAAAYSGHQAEARTIAADLEQMARQTPSPWIHACLRSADALLATDDDAEDLYEVALAADVTRYPVMRARLQLAYGRWLRRQRRNADSRAPLRAARQAFDALGLIPWGERARRELRASGEKSRPRAPTARDQLTPQELQIAQLAAEGLSNREIGEQLYLSPRTVGTHLYRIFPKLGITSRSQLHTVLDAEPALHGGPTHQQSRLRPAPPDSRAWRAADPDR